MWNPFLFPTPNLWGRAGINIFIYYMKNCILCLSSSQLGTDSEHSLDDTSDRQTDTEGAADFGTGGSRHKILTLCCVLKPSSKMSS